jgi:DNA-binding response OmpR family regulator
MGFDCAMVPRDGDVLTRVDDFSPNVVLLQVDESAADPGEDDLGASGKWGRRVPVIALISRSQLEMLGPSVAADDFVLSPWDGDEVALRIERAVRRMRRSGGGNVIECGDMVIDTDNCEVTIDGRPIALTFKEYELLRFLAGNRGRVFSREDLLSRVWGYDYFGGARTVDVHVRRLRSKIEDPTHTFVETVRNVGYRFRKDAQ